MGRDMSKLGHSRDAGYWSWVLIAALGCAGVARANDCQLTIEANDMIQFNARTLQVDANCKLVELTLRHVGKQDAHTIGHDWVLSRTSDVSAITSRGLTAGFDSGYLPVGDKRIIAATKIVGGGESTTISFSTAALVAGGDYSFFCSYPGHSPMMKGRFVFTGAQDLASNRPAATDQATSSH
jgi:azurin